MDSRTDQCQEHEIKVLSEWLGSLRITKENALERTTEYTDNMLTALAVYNEIAHVIMLKSMVPDPGWFNGDQMKFEDWWREIQLFLKSNRVTGTDNKITTILACLRGDIASIYAQKKLDELDKETDTPSWEDFVGEPKTIF